MSSKPDFESSASQESSGSFTETRSEHSFSQSVNNILRQISGLEQGADLLQLLELFDVVHPEYGTGNPGFGKTKSSEIEPLKEMIEFLHQHRRKLRLSKFSNVQWAEEVLSIFHIPNEPPVIDGRLFLIAAILVNFKEVQGQLEIDTGWFEKCSELIKKVDEELLNMSEISYTSLLTEKGYVLNDSLRQENKADLIEKLEQSIIDTNNLTDGPAKEDSLSRKALATYLAKRLRHIYNRDIDKGKYGSFFMHIDGAWGSGKSTLLGFLEEELKSGVPEDQESKTSKLSDGKWVIVNFNAWENQRLDPPWWFLMKSLFTEAKKSLKSNFNNEGHPEYSKQDKKRIRQLIRSEYLWRIKSGNSYLMVAGITFILLIFSLGVGAFSKTKFVELPIVQLVTLTGFLWSLAKTFTSGLVSGTAKAAQKFIEENGKDPLQEIAEHFKDQINIIGYPVAIFIDDLDRCNIEYGIRLLEGLQTIFKKAGVVYVIAADRKWLSTMYEHQYANFAPVLEKPSKPFGMIFLDKIFQLIVELPDISSVQKKIYLDKLLRVRNNVDPDKINAEKSAIRERVMAAATNAQKMDIANIKNDNPEIEQEAREVALGTFSIREEENILEHHLQHFIDLIEPNPRAMKRLINDISTARAISFLYKQTVDQDQLILWTIFKQQHPLLAGFFWNNPEKLDEINWNGDQKQSITNIGEYDNLLKDQDVKKLFYYIVNGEIIKLDSDFLRKMKFQDTNETPIRKKTDSGTKKPDFA